MSECVEKVRYICLNCGVIYESGAKVPQCPVCRRKKRMKFEDFLRLKRELSELEEFKDASERDIVEFVLSRRLISVKFEDFEVLNELAKRENKPIFEVVHEAVECLRRKRNFWQKLVFW